MTTGDNELLTSIEVPRFQRDYAQGRDSDQVRRIRRDFLEALRPALVGPDPTPVGLDFVYGGVVKGTLQPLDGQQRLTTMFLLHWYFASRSGRLSVEEGWTKFSYATRQSARMFCESLVHHPLPGTDETPSSWIEDQPWYMFLWRHDPTIQSMLVMLDAIDEGFREVDPEWAWERLTDSENPAIWFLLLPLSGLAGEGDDTRPEDLYIKMNSRGKPLTEFENFKAHFEKTLQWSSRARDFALNVDTTWSDLLWGLRGEDDLIDDEFVRLIEFVTEICEWRESRTDGAGRPLTERTRTVFGDDDPHREEHLEFLFNSFDAWREPPIGDTLKKFFTGATTPEGDALKVRLFFRQELTETELVDLFEACSRLYGETRGRNRIFSLGQTLIFYAVVLHVIEDTEAFSQRVRVLRNLVEASSNELRFERAPQILDDVHALIRDGNLTSVKELNKDQLQDEARKAAFLEANPELRDAVYRLEDHELLRGSLVSFELTHAEFESRANAFHQLMAASDQWADLLGAFLAAGEYQRMRKRWSYFGTSSKRHDNAWRELFTRGSYESRNATRQVLGEFLDSVAAAPTDLTETLAAIRASYLAKCEEEGRFDWRYYMVKYRAMRDRGSSTYFADREDDSEDAIVGYSLCMLRAGGQALHGWYRDPYMLAITREVDNEDVLGEQRFRNRGTPRWHPLTRSGTSIRCVTAGFEVAPPPAGMHAQEFEAARVELGLDDDNAIAVSQVEIDGQLIDTVNRIQVGADIIRTLAQAGL